ncbi:MAG: D-alanyl-D-alanine carboxypeptidase [Ruminococcus sp.]|nr:D-alanyl-D-alanine carboxypeptidase [Ruminococcus sp.]
MCRLRIITVIIFSVFLSFLFLLSYNFCYANAENIENADIYTSAKSCIVLEANTKEVLFAENEKEQLPMASTTKIMSTLLCLESGDLDSEFTVDSDAIKVEGSSMGLVEGDIVTKRALCYGMLLPSGNDAAGATAVKIAGSYEAFAEKMNARAKEIGMTQTNFVTPSGLHDDNHYSTAYDMALLTAEALQNPDFKEICSKTTAQVRFGNPPFDRWLKNTNKLLNMYENVIGVKTGFTDEAGRCLVSACTKNDVTLICVTLNDKNDWLDHSNLYDYIFSKIKIDTFPLPESLHIPVAGGTVESVAIGVNQDLTYGTLSKIDPDFNWAVYAQPFLYAPVEENQKVGILYCTCNGHEIAKIPLYTKESIEKIQPAEKETGIKTTMWGKIKSFLHLS